MDYVYEVTKDGTHGVFTPKVMERNYPFVLETMKKFDVTHLEMSNNNKTIQVRKAPRSKFVPEVVVGVNSGDK